MDDSSQDDRGNRRYPRKKFEAPVSLFVENAEAEGQILNVSMGESIVSVELRLTQEDGRLNLEENAPVRVDIPWLAVLEGQGRIVRVTRGEEGTKVAVVFDAPPEEAPRRAIDKLLHEFAEAEEQLESRSWST